MIIKDVTQAHKLYKKTLSEGDSGMQALFGHASYRNRELYLCTMVYDLPKV